MLFGNIAEKGCIVKTAGVDESILKFTGRARVFESQDEAAAAIGCTSRGVASRTSPIGMAVPDGSNRYQRPPSQTST